MCRRTPQGGTEVHASDGLKLVPQYLSFRDSEIDAGKKKTILVFWQDNNLRFTEFVV